MIVNDDEVVKIIFSSSKGSSAGWNELEPGL